MSSAATAAAPDAGSLFTPVRPPVSAAAAAAAAAAADAPAVSNGRPSRKRASKATEKEEEAAAAPAEESAPVKGRSKRQKVQPAPAAAAAAAAEGEPAADEPASATYGDAAAAMEDTAATSSAPAAAASASADAVERVAPEALSFPASLLSSPMSAYGPAFDTIARELLLNLELHCNGHVLRVLECEFYWRADEPAGVAVPDGGHHHDVFAHASPMQHNNYGRWYWHRQGTKPDASYKGGSYKGLDVTCGPVGGTGHGGILIRAVQRVSDGVCIEGSCLVADEVLRLHKATSIAEVVARWNGNICAFSNPTLFFARAKHRLPSPKSGAPLIVRSPRVGLTLKQAGATRPRFIMLPYRYCRVDVPGFVNKKQKQTLLLSAYEELGGGAEAKQLIQKMCGATAGYFAQHVAAFEAGKLLKGMDKFVAAKAGAGSAEELSQMYGAWMKQFGGKHVAFIRAD